MRLLRSSALAAVLAMTAATVVGPSAAQAQISIGISVNFAPPPLPVYEQPAIPEPGYMWVPGYWAWDDDYYDYYWVPGTWAPPPEPGLLWTPAWWGWSNGGYGFHEGYWGQQIGFYGGVVYGFGYDGSGYQGGYWQNNQFFYNRSVNNVTNVNITNVYNKTVIINRGATASFNGPGGATATPTPQQVAVEHERHVPPTALQTQNVKAAAATPSLRASANHGAPPIAAAAKPGAFTGPGTVKAAKAGGAYQPPAAAVQKQAQIRAAHGQVAGPAAHPGPVAPGGKTAAVHPPGAPTTAVKTGNPPNHPPGADERRTVVQPPGHATTPPPPARLRTTPPPPARTTVRPATPPRVETRAVTAPRPSAGPPPHAPPRPPPPKAAPPKPPPPPHGDERKTPPG